jgi:hypothetical protein
MRRNQKGFGVIEMLLAIVAVGLLGFTSWHVYHLKNSSGLSTSKPTVLAEIKNSGSTNFTSWNLILYSDDSAYLDCNNGTQAHRSCSNTSYRPRSFSSDLQSDLAKAKLSSHYNCIRSVSFGTQETLIYKGRPTIGVDCYFSANPDSSLSKDIVPFLQKANLN